MRCEQARAHPRGGRCANRTIPRSAPPSSHRMRVRAFACGAGRARAGRLRLALLRGPRLPSRARTQRSAAACSVLAALALQLTPWCVCRFVRAAIARMLARRHGMMGANDVQAAQIDCVYEHGILLHSPSSPRPPCRACTPPFTSHLLQRVAAVRQSRPRAARASRQPALRAAPLRAGWRVRRPMRDGGAAETVKL